MRSGARTVSLLIMAPPLAHCKHTAMEGLATLGAPLASDRMWNNFFCLPRSGHHHTVYPRYASYTIVSMGIVSLVSCVPISTNVTCAIAQRKLVNQCRRTGLVQTVSDVSFALVCFWFSYLLLSWISNYGLLSVTTPIHIHTHTHIPACSCRQAGYTLRLRHPSWVFIHRADILLQSTYTISCTHWLMLTHTYHWPQPRMLNMSTHSICLN